MSKPTIINRFDAKSLSRAALENAKRRDAATVKNRWSKFIKSMTKHDSEDARIYHAQTLAVHAADEANETTAVTSPIWQTSTFRAESGAHFAALVAGARTENFYTRYGNPNAHQAERTIARMEAAEDCLLLGSGMSAIFCAVLCDLQAGDHVVAQTNLYASTATLLREVLPRYQIACTLVDQTKVEDFSRAINERTKLVYIESPSNPTMALTDIGAVVELARAHRVRTVIDSTFATPVNQQPITHGIDAVVHSATKFLGGHSDLVAGAIVSSKDFIEKAWRFAVTTGATASPFDAWLLLRGLRTLPLRVERHNHNAVQLARFLETHAQVARVFYPGLESHAQHRLAQKQMRGFTGVLSLELNGGFAAAETLIENLKLATYAASLGGFETLVVHPAAMWAQALTEEQLSEMSVSAGLVRVSVGLEDERDLIADFDQALARLA